jgi:hypothetical protein
MGRKKLDCISPAPSLEVLTDRLNLIMVVDAKLKAHHISRARIEDNVNSGA